MFEIGVPVRSISLLRITAQLAVTAALISGCGQAAPGLAKSEIAELRAKMPGMTDDCADRIKRDGIGAFPIETDRCFKMRPAQRFQGLLSKSFEDSRFCAAPAQSCPSQATDEYVWLSFADRNQAKALGNERGLYEIDFIGRQTAEKGAHGHLGLAPHEVIVDKVISVRLVRKYEG